MLSKSLSAVVIILMYILRDKRKDKYTDTANPYETETRITYKNTSTPETSKFRPRDSCEV